MIIKTNLVSDLLKDVFMNSKDNLQMNLMSQYETNLFFE